MATSISITANGVPVTTTLSQINYNNGNSIFLSTTGSTTKEGDSINIKQISCKFSDLTADEQTAINTFEAAMAGVYSRLHSSGVNNQNMI
jgi:uncharacterized protein YggE